ncbi:2312_t:CDS:1, partial [Dentiscutata heterogama]
LKKTGRKSSLNGNINLLSTGQNAYLAPRLISRSLSPSSEPIRAPAEN